MAPSVGLSGFPDIQWTLDEMIAEGDKVAARFTMWGTHQGAFFGVPPSGKKIEVKAMNFYLYWVWKWLVESHMKSRKSRRNFRRSIDQEEGRHVALVRAERHAFYEKTKNAYAIVATGEPRPYVNVLLKRGVVLNQT